ncbi:MAG: alanine racemase [Desulfosudaceae bacterium]
MTEPLIWAEIDLAAVARNVRALKSLVGDRCALMAVVKANAYGHGMIPIARTALENGAAALGVSRIEEALALREAGMTAPVLILGATPPSAFPDIARHDFRQTIWEQGQAEALSRAAVAAKKPIRIHVKIDTGMGRLGLTALPSGDSGTMTEAIRQTAAAAELPGLILEGVFTHFAAADAADKASACAQLDGFRHFLAELRQAGLSPAQCHAANSAALIDLPESRLDMVRTGLSLYGLYPSEAVNHDQVVLTPAMALKARLIQVRKVPAGFTVSYGATYTTPRPTTLAVVPAGYADGYSRALSSRGTMLVRGRRVPVVGRVCMDLTVLDVGGLDAVAVGDEAVIFGRQEGAAIPVEEVAAALDTINYEVVSTVAERVPRVYL